MSWQLIFLLLWESSSDRWSYHLKVGPRTKGGEGTLLEFIFQNGHKGIYGILITLYFKQPILGMRCCVPSDYFCHQSIWTISYRKRYHFFYRRVMMLYGNIMFYRSLVVIEEWMVESVNALSLVLVQLVEVIRCEQWHQGCLNNFEQDYSTYFWDWLVSFEHRS